jgi:hypothetical protein
LAPSGCATFDSNNCALQHRLSRGASSQSRFAFRGRAVISSAGNPSRGGKPVISAVLFDMNEVLCRYDREARIACLARVCAKAPSFVEAAIWGSGYEDLADSGAMDAEAYLSGFGERLGCALTRKQWIARDRSRLSRAEANLRQALFRLGRIWRAQARPRSL